MIDPNRLNVFLQAAETLSFSHAAQLFERSGAGLRLTEAGQSLIPLARRMLQQSNDFQAMVNSLHEDIAGHSRIAYTTAAGKYILPHLAARFRARHPSVRISILACTQVDALERILE